MIRQRIAVLGVALFAVLGGFAGSFSTGLKSSQGQPATGGSGYVQVDKGFFDGD